MTEAWELRHEATLALAVGRLLSEFWDSIAMEVQRKCSDLREDLTTAHQCRLKYEELIRRFENLDPRPEAVSGVCDMAVRDAVAYRLNKLRQELSLDDDSTQYKSNLKPKKSDVDLFIERLRSIIGKNEMHKVAAGGQDEKGNSVEEFLLACLGTLRHESGDWESIAMEVQSSNKSSSLPRELATSADRGRLRSEHELLPRYGDDFLVVTEEQAMRNTVWGLRDVLLLGCASMLHDRGDWDAISNEVRKRSLLPHGLTTARDCMLKHRDLICTFGVEGPVRRQENIRDLICTFVVLVFPVPGENISALKDLLSSDLANSILDRLAEHEQRCRGPSQEIENKDVVFAFGEEEVVVLEKQRVSEIKKTIIKLETTFDDSTVEMVEMMRTLESNFPTAIPIPDPESKSNHRVEFDGGFRFDMDRSKYFDLRRATPLLPDNYPDCTDKSDDSETGGAPYIVLGDYELLPFEETLESLERRSVDLILQLASHKKKIDNLLEKQLAYHCRF